MRGETAGLPSSGMTRASVDHFDHEHDVVGRLQAARTCDEPVASNGVAAVGCEAKGGPGPLRAPVLATGRCYLDDSSAAASSAREPLRMFVMP